MSEEPPGRALLSVPAWLWGGNPKRLLEESDYHFGADRSGMFYVQTAERYYHRKPRLVRLLTIARPGAASASWEELARLKERVDVDHLSGLSAGLEGRRQKAEQSRVLVDALNYHRLLLYTLPIKDLPAHARDLVEHLNGVRFTEDPAEGPFANVGVHVVTTDPALVRRLRMASVWLRIEHDARLAGGDASHITALNARGDSVFASSFGLNDGVMLFDAYLAPLLAAGSPGVWAINVVRTFGSLIFTLGTFVSGADGDASELLQLVTTPGASEAVKMPQLSASAGLDALSGGPNDLTSCSEYSATWQRSPIGRRSTGQRSTLKRCSRSSRSSGGRPQCSSRIVTPTPGGRSSSRCWTPSRACVPRIFSLCARSAMHRRPLLPLSSQCPHQPRRFCSQRPGAL